MKRLVGIISAVILLISCYEENPQKESRTFILPKTQFKAPLKKKFINLSNKLGSELQTIENGDTIKYQFSFIKSNKNNVITKDSDTIFNGTVCKMARNTFVLNYKTPNNNYYLTGIKLTDSTITSFETVIDQAIAFDNILIDTSYSQFIADSGSYQLFHPTKKMAKELFFTVINQMPQVKLAKENIKSFSEDEFNNDEIEKLGIISKLYPNPALDKINIVTNTSLVNYDYVITNQKGQISGRGKLIEGINTIDISGWAPGLFILQIPATKETHKFIKK